MDKDEILEPMKRSILLISLLGFSMAQAQSAQDIIKKVDSTQRNARDITFRVSGNASLENNTSQKIDFTVKTIPTQTIARLQFAAPDALADNIIITDKNEVRQYLFLTNQITITPLQKAANSAGIQDLDFTQLSNTASLLTQYNVKLISSNGATSNRTFQLEATPKNGSDRTRIWISEAGWHPTRIQLLSGNKVMADLNISNYKTNTGLNASTLKQLPKNAQIIRQ